MKQFGMSLLSWQLIILIWLMTKALLIPIFFILKKKFIPASDYMSAIKVAKRLQDDGFTPIINLLGEHCVSRKKIKQTFRQYLYLVDALCEAGIKGKISVSSPLGLAAIGKSKGDVFSFQTPGGMMSYKIIDIK